MLVISQDHSVAQMTEVLLQNGTTTKFTDGWMRLFTEVVGGE